MSFLARYNAAVGKWRPLVLLGVGGAHPANERALYTEKDQLTLRTADPPKRWTKELSEDTCIRTVTVANHGFQNRKYVFHPFEDNVQIGEINER